MNESHIRQLFERFQAGSISIDDAVSSLRNLPFEDMGFATVDHHRALRRGFPEVIFCSGKTPLQVAAIAERMLAAGSDVLGTRASSETYAEVARRIPDAVYHAEARVIVVQKEKKAVGRGLVLVVSAGTSDIPVAEEAAVTAEVMGNEVGRIFDVGVAGIHRLFAHRETILQAAVVIVVAGMEGALASVVGGLVARPVIAVPTSVGYGASFGGLAALLGMLTSCASGVTVVNIDNGFGAGYAASLINRRDTP
ncbi:MAG: nickel pincer cofactor biosynthesis protein LarB [candidate division Zixibacteria bacterium]|nr:nickel pincer cofactor biosynthesis protein LarB [candidate division Zixibacteria bacterium]